MEIMKKTKEKKIIAPNECSFGRWVAVLVVGLLIGLVLAAPLYFLLYNREGSFMGISYLDFFNVLAFAPLFWGLVISIRFIGKTSFKDFVLGVGGRINAKQCLIVAGLYAGGFAIPFLLTAKNIELRGVNPGEFIFLVVLMVLIAWMQTTTEEVMFRGLFIRWGCKNKLGYTKKAIILAVISALIFAIAHAPNPEVTSNSGWDIAIAVLAYAIHGFMLFWANLHFGNLLPGFIMHLINNFLLFTVISSEISVVTYPTLLVDKTPESALWSLGSTILVYLPVAIYIIIDIIRRKKISAK